MNVQLIAEICIAVIATVAWRHHKRAKAEHSSRENRRSSKGQRSGTRACGVTGIKTLRGIRDALSGKRRST